MDGPGRACGPRPPVITGGNEEERPGRSWTGLDNAAGAHVGESAHERIQGKRSPHCCGPAAAVRRSDPAAGTRPGGINSRADQPPVDRWLVSVGLGARHDREATSTDPLSASTFCARTPEPGHASAGAPDRPPATWRNPGHTGSGRSQRAVVICDESPGQQRTSTARAPFVGRGEENRSPWAWCRSARARATRRDQEADCERESDCRNRSFTHPIRARHPCEAGCSRSPRVVVAPRYQAVMCGGSDPLLRGQRRESPLLLSKG